MEGTGESKGRGNNNQNTLHEIKVLFSLKGKEKILPFLLSLQEGGG